MLYTGIQSADTEALCCHGNRRPRNQFCGEQHFTT